ncbi:hypothetical protein ABBQ38_012859 [Trebouxia sp. C0009 RCD-2024]
MLDAFCIFTKGGALLWTMQLAALRGDPVNALIRTCLLEERLGESSFSYTPPSGSAYTMKWTLHNGLGLVFVAVYQRALQLLYVDELLERVKHEFAQQYKPDQFKYKSFEDSFRHMLKDAENSADISKHPTQAMSSTKAYSRKQGNRGADTAQISSKGDDDEADSDSTTSASSSDLQQVGKANGAGGNKDQSMQKANATTTGVTASSNGAFDTSAMKNKLNVKRPPGGKMSKKALMERAKEDRKKSDTGDKAKGKPKEARKWATGHSKNETLDYSEKSDGVRGASDADSGAESISMQQKSLVDMDEDFSDDSEEEAEATETSSKAGGLLSSFVRNIGMNVMGTQSLALEDIQPALEQLKKKLMERNVAEEIAAKLCESVATTLVGKKLGSFTRVSSAVRTAVEDAIVRILTPKRSIDVLREAQAARSRSALCHSMDRQCEPYPQPFGFMCS